MAIYASAIKFDAQWQYITIRWKRDVATATRTTTTSKLKTTTTTRRSKATTAATTTTT